MTARISVIVPCYNHGAFVDQAVQSVLAQTHSDVEILIVDDGSDDPQTRALLADYRQPKTTVIHSPQNQGLPAARNLGIKESQGEFLCFLDADDRLEPSYFAEALAILDGDAEVTFVSHWLEAFGDEAWSWRPQRCDLQTVLHGNTINGAALVRREALSAVGLFDESFSDGCEDWDLWLSLLEAGHRGVILPKVLFDYRRRADSMSRLMSAPESLARIAVQRVTKHVETYRDHLRPLFAKQELELCLAQRKLDEEEHTYINQLIPELLDRRREISALTQRWERAQATDDTLQGMRRELAQLERQTAQAAQRHQVQLERQTAQAAQRQAQLQDQCDSLEQQLIGRNDAVGAARTEVAALRKSLSWQVTAPLRSGYDWLTRRSPSGDDSGDNNGDNDGDDRGDSNG